MDKKSKVQTYLERIEMIDTIIENKLIEQRQWKELAMSISANMDGERVQTSKAVSKMADAVINAVAMEAEIADAVDKLIAEKRKITQTLEKLDNPTWYRILHMRYVQYIKLKDIATQLNKDYDWVTTTHGRALRGVQNIISQAKCDSV